MRKHLTAGFFLKIVLPALLAILMFIMSVFLFIIPAFERNALEQKRNMLNELTNTTWSILSKYHADEVQGLLSAGEARQKAMDEIEVLRYGPDKKDYFWITDLTPRMIMHPYVHELTGKSLQDYSDPDGKKIFIIAAEIVKKSDEGFISYQWQFMDDTTRIVPKLSFVKKFAPWGWIIGTGIYLDDVQFEISLLTRKLIYVLLGITGIISLIIVFIAFQSFKIEGRKQAAEDQLHESKEKYKSLLGSSTEGIILLLNSRISYSNTFVQNLLNYTREELANLPVNELFANKEIPEFSESEGGKKIETGLVRKDGTITEAVLTILPVRFADKQGLLLTIRDISEHRTVRTKLEDLKTLVELISANTGIGIFRFSLSGKSRLMEFNANMASILGYNNDSEFKNTPLIHILANRADLKKLLQELREKRIVAGRQVKLRKKDGSETLTRLSLVLTVNNGDDLFCDGIIEPMIISEAVPDEILRFSQQLDSIVNSNKRSLTEFSSPLVICPFNATFRQAVEIMKNSNSSFILLMMNQQCIGILTCNDIVTRFSGVGNSPENLVSEFMTSPVVHIGESAGIAEAIAIMEARGISHLLIKNEEGELSGVLEKSKICGVYVNPADVIARAIDSLSVNSTFLRIRMQIPYIIKPLLNGSSNAHSLNRMIANFNDGIAIQIIKTAIAGFGEPPVPFAFFSTGSEGRQEPVFNSDQDNAIIYMDDPLVPADVLHKYFLDLGKDICNRLDKSGLPFCKGQYMAANPRWCQPFSIWKEYIRDWIVNSEPVNILNISAFFDLRMIYGDQALFSRLEEYIFNEFKGRSAFFYMLAQSVIAFRPPLNVFGNIITETIGKNAEVIDIKNSLSPVVMFARIYALQYNIRLKGTVERMNALSTMKVLSQETVNEVAFHYNFLMHLRLRHQLEQLSLNEEVDNMIEPKKLTEIEMIILKKVFSQINSYQDYLSVSFMGGQRGI